MVAVSAKYAPNEQQFREAAILYGAIFSVIWDEQSLGSAIDFAKGFAECADDPHSGDCTNECHSCARCQWEEWLAEAHAYFESDD